MCGHGLFFYFGYTNTPSKLKKDMKAKLKSKQNIDQTNDYVN